MVERTEPMQGKSINSEKQYAMRLMNNLMARIILRLIPVFGEEFQHYNIGYLSTAVSVHSSYLAEVLDFLCDSDLVSFDGEGYFLSQDNLWKISDVLNRQSIVILLRKIEALEGSNKVIS